MSIETFRKAMLEIGDESVSIGGGEPTLHPLFWQILGESMGFSDYVWLATNGSITETALSLAKMAKKGVIGCALSQDYYHDEIEQSVIDAFTKTKAHAYDRNTDDNREIRDVSNNIINSGRAKDNDITDKIDCVCPDLIIKPNGDVMSCGCEDALCFGNVHKSVTMPEDWEYGECHKSQN